MGGGSNDAHWLAYNEGHRLFPGRRLKAKKRNPMAVQHRGTNWTPEEDRRLLELIEAGKSLVFISANLKRPVKTIRDRISQMRRSGLKAKGK